MMEILLIHVGGTFGMVEEKNVLITKTGNLQKNLLKSKCFNMYNSFKNLVYKNKNGEEISYKIHEETHLKDSSDANVDDYLNILKIIKENYEKYSGFIVIHGTDTMSYAASAISFLIENISKPVIFTGSMISLFKDKSDAFDNLSGAFDALLTNPNPNVYIYFNKKLLIGNRSTKTNSESVNAFCDLNKKLLIGNMSTKTNSESVNAFCDFYSNDTINNRIRFYEKLSSKIARIIIHPFIDYNIIEYIFKNNHGILIDTYGCGNISVDLYKIIEKYSENTLVVVISQCFYGKIYGDYEIGSKLLKLKNVINGRDIRAEAALAKLSFLLGNFNFSEANKLYKSNLRGELADH